MGKCETPTHQSTLYSNMVGQTEHILWTGMYLHMNNYHPGPADRSTTIAAGLFL
jgi:hypothetical protein